MNKRRIGGKSGLQGEGLCNRLKIRILIYGDDLVSTEKKMVRTASRALRVARK